MPFEERRINRILMSYWQQIKGNRLFPQESDINPEELKEIWDCCFVLKITGGSLQQPDYKYTYMGETIIQAYDKSLSGEEVYKQLMAPSYGAINQQFRKVMVTRSPMVDEGEFTNPSNLMVKYRLCVLPLGEGDKIDHILGGMRWLAY